MNSLSEKREKAITLKKAENFSDAIPLFEILWEKDNDKWDGWNLAFCYNKCSNFELALNISKKVYHLDKEFNYIKEQYAWAAYMLKIKDLDFSDNFDLLERYANGIIKLTQEDNVFRHLTILKIMDFCNKNTYWEKLIYWSKKISPEDLDSNSYTVNKKNKNITIPSKKEKWYLKVTKAYEKTGNWDQCLKECNKALNFFPNVIWFLWRKAISMGNRGDVDIAIKLLEKISLIKSEWFIYRDIAKLYAQQDNIDIALDNIFKACIKSVKQPDLEYKWELFYYAASYLNKKNNKEMAVSHLLLSYTLRDGKGWKIPEKLSNLSIQLNVELESVSDKSESIKELQSFWDKQKYEQLQRYSGKIKAILPNGKAGFITSDKNKDYYFNLYSCKIPNEEIKPGKRISFYLEESFDKKKNINSFRAVNISK
jgi:tetratricopeptide (TPR) repeat protein